jgi:hypothetical protein
MTTEELLQIRLENHGLIKSRFSTPAEVVRWSGAIQAQDYLGSLWSIGQRIPRIFEHDIERSIENRQIVRTWPMRGPLHFVSAEDVRWMQRLLTPRVIAKKRSLYAQQGLDMKTLTKSRRVIEGALQKKGRLTRTEMYATLQDQKIAVTGQRGIHIVNFAAQEQLICLGPRERKQRFDEFIIAYKDRSSAFDSSTKTFIEKPKNGLYSPVILINGKISGKWSRSFSKGKVEVALELFRKVSLAEKDALDRSVNKYESFLKRLEP